MNIKNNIINYLFDQDYVISLYDEFIYFFNYKYLESFSDKIVSLKVENRFVTIRGDNLTIIRITKEELLIKGNIKNIEMKIKDEQTNKDKIER